MNNENTNKWIDKDILLGEVLPISEYITTHPFSILQKEYGIKYDDIKKDLNDEINDEKAQYFYDKFMEDGDLDIDDDGGYKLANSTNTKNNMGLAKKYKIPMRTIKLICFT